MAQCSNSIPRSQTPLNSRKSDNTIGHTSTEPTARAVIYLHGQGKLQLSYGKISSSQKRTSDYIECFDSNSKQQMGVEQRKRLEGSIKFVDLLLEEFGFGGEEEEEVRYTTHVQGTLNSPH